MYDLIIIGAGPAGTSAAITAATAGARVMLLERGILPRHKVCGEFVSPESLDLLSSLLPAATSKLLHEAPRISAARLFVDDRVLNSSITPPAASIARFDLDVTLWKAAQNRGVETCAQTTVQSIANHGPFQVSTSAGSFEARAIIDASGRWSNLNAAPNGKHTGKWLGLKAHFAESTPPPSVDLYFFEGGYCGVQPVALTSDDHSDQTSSNRINVCAMVRADVASTLPEVFTRHASLGERSKEWKAITTPVTTSPLLFRPPKPLRKNILVAGDAAGFIDPFVGDGISLALRSGALAAQSLLPFFKGKLELEKAATTYRSRYESELLPVFKSSSKIRRLFSLPKIMRIPLMLLFQNTPALTQYLLRKTR
jgi:flavin-dependent dehydrogenase